jgi:hypothetical protein
VEEKDELMVDCWLSLSSGVMGLPIISLQEGSKQDDQLRRRINN